MSLSLILYNHNSPNTARHPATCSYRLTKENRTDDNNIVSWILQKVSALYAVCMLYITSMKGRKSAILSKFDYPTSQTVLHNEYIHVTFHCD